MGEISIAPKFNIHETYKKVRILNPYRNSGVPVSGIDPDYQAKLDYAAGNFIPVPVGADSDFYNQRIIDFKANGGFDISDVVLDFEGNADPAFKLICNKRRVECLPYGGLTWSTDGVEGNGTNGYIDSLFIPTADGVNYTKNNAGFIWTAKKGIKNSSVIFGAQTGAGGGGIVRFGPTSNGGNVSLNSGATANTNNFTQIGVNSFNRLDVSNLIVKGGSDYTFVSTSSSEPTNSMYILAGNNGAGGNAPFAHSTEKLGFFAIGGSYAAVHDAVLTGL